MLANVAKNFFLHLSKNRILNKGAKKWGMKIGATEVVAGTTIDDMVHYVKQLNEKGLCCTLDHLGEFVTSKVEALQATDHIIKTIHVIAEEGLNSEVSVKLTQLGVDIDRQFCLENMKAILQAAEMHGIFVTIDMEDYLHCSLTLDLLKELRKTYDGVGTVIQAYLFRSLQDVKDLKGVKLRLVKGAYKESNAVAFQDRDSIDENFLKLIKAHLLSGSYTAIATHDHHIMEKAKIFVKEQNIPRDQFEFQLLYGFRKDIQMKLVKEGYKVRVYVPYGNDWFAYYMRRLAERPQNITFALKGLFLK